MRSAVTTAQALKFAVVLFRPVASTSLRFHYCRATATGLLVDLGLGVGGRLGVGTLRRLADSPGGGRAEGPSLWPRRIR